MKGNGYRAQMKMVKKFGGHLSILAMIMVGFVAIAYISKEINPQLIYQMSGQTETGQSTSCCDLFVPYMNTGQTDIIEPNQPTVRSSTQVLGSEVSIAYHLADGEEQSLSTLALLSHGADLFNAVWTSQEGGGRPLTKGTGAPLADQSDPLTFPRNFNRVSGPDANSCAGCHNAPYGIAGGGGDIVSSVFVLGQRFDFATFDQSETIPTKGAVDENGEPVTLQSIANMRATVGMFGSGYIEMLARQITADLQVVRNTLRPGESRILMSKGIGFGSLSRNTDGSWNTANVTGLAPASLASTGFVPPSLIIRPFHQASAVVSLREFSNNAFNHHHGIQSAERFGIDQDPDGDNFVNELTRADVTAVSLFQAAMAVPGRLIPSDPTVRDAIWNGEQLFRSIGCASCHLPQLPLEDSGWIYTEPNPYNPNNNLQVGTVPTVEMDLSSTQLPQPRLTPNNGIVSVPAYTDFRLHDITSGPDDPNVEKLNMHAAAGSADFTDGNQRFMTKKLWGAANEPPYFHHGLFTTLREATLAHSGEALGERQAFESLPEYDKNSVIEFLKSLQILPPGTQHLAIDENGNAVNWPPE